VIVSVNYGMQAVMRNRVTVRVADDPRLPYQQPSPGNRTPGRSQGAPWALVARLVHLTAPRYMVWSNCYRGSNTV